MSRPADAAREVERGRVSIRAMRGGVYASRVQDSRRPDRPVTAVTEATGSARRAGASPVIRAFTLGDFETNCYVVTVPGAADESMRRHAWIVDVGQDPQPMLDAVLREGLDVKAILFTHAHADHIAGVDEAIARLGPHVPRLAHRSETSAFEDPEFNLSAFVGAPISVSAPTGELTPGSTLELAGTSWRVVHTPGHSPGGVTLVHDASKQALVGDTLFAGSIGRTDFPTSNAEAMKHTLFDVLLALPDDMRVHPGHGPATTIGIERRSNPWLKPGSW